MPPLWLLLSLLVLPLLNFDSCAAPLQVQKPAHALSASCQARCASSEQCIKLAGHKCSCCVCT